MPVSILLKMHLGGRATIHASAASITKQPNGSGTAPLGLVIGDIKKVLRVSDGAGTGFKYMII